MEVITPEYTTEQRSLHQRDKVYGSLGSNWAYLVAGIASVERTSTILDYGCGKGSMGMVLRGAGYKVQDYDPGIVQYSAMPKPAQLVSCLDVLEHVEPECLDTVLDHIRSLCQRLLFVVIAGRPAGRFLSDGRNAHLIIEDRVFWRPRFEKRGFAVRRDWRTGVAEWVALMQVSR
jgi:2-polyprenyl-3-methyl-5-hydroxy-6-metoxy-1,4-benzoquinol methylase